MDTEGDETEAGDPDAEHKMVQNVLDSLLQEDADAEKPTQVKLHPGVCTQDS